MSSPPATTIAPVRPELVGDGFPSKPAIWPSRSNEKIPIVDASAMVTGWAAIVMSALVSM